ncbi:hypothetical protein ACJJTC_001049 [Scirpophaga incertulas]
MQRYTKVEIWMDEAEALALKAQEREKVSREEGAALRAQLQQAAEDARQLATAKDELSRVLQDTRQKLDDAERQLDMVKKELEAMRSEKDSRVAELERRLEEADREMESLRLRMPPPQIESDTENYMKWRFCGGTLKLKKGAVPTKFECQKTKRASSITRSGYDKRQKIDFYENLLTKKCGHQ